MILARNTITVGPNYVNTLEKDTFIPSDKPLVKLNVFVFRNPVILWPTENDPPAWMAESDMEIQLDNGFISLVPFIPWTGVRFKSMSSLGSDLRIIGYA